MITGFRVGLGGAQARYGITPDLSIFGKVIGGGLPLAAVGGAAALMDQLAPLGAVYQAGTLSGTRSRPRPGSRCSPSSTTTRTHALERTAERLDDGLRKAFADAGVAAQVTRVFTLVGMFFADAPVHDYEAAQARRPRALRRSSTGCSTAACSSRRAATRRCSRAWRTPTPTSTPRSTPRSRRRRRS